MIHLPTVGDKVILTGHRHGKERNKTAIVMDVFPKRTSLGYDFSVKDGNGVIWHSTYDTSNKWCCAPLIYNDTEDSDDKPKRGAIKIVDYESFLKATGEN